MEALHEQTHTRDDPVLVASTERRAEVSAEVAVVAAASMAVAATDSSREVHKP